MNLFNAAEIKDSTLLHGKFIEDFSESRPSDIAYDADARKRLWLSSEKITGIRWDDVSECVNV